jgi:phage gp16-like protein
MCVKELEQVIEHFKSVGFKVKTRKRYSPKTADNTLGEVAKIRALWITMYKAGFVKDGSEQALDKFITRSLKAPQGISYHASFLKQDQARFVVEILKQWQKRVGIKAKLQESKH